MTTWKTATPEQKFTITVMRFSGVWGAIDAMRQVAFAGLPLAATVIAAQHRAHATTYTRNLIEGIKDEDDLNQTAEMMREMMTNRALQDASRAVDAAALVFAHSMLDDALNCFIEITCDVAHEFWVRRVSQRKVELGTLTKRSVEEVTRDTIREQVLIMSRDSMAKRADVLHEVCTVLATRPSYKYDRATLVRIDKIRQAIVHGDLLGKEIGTIEADLDYLRRTWEYFFVTMHRSFGLGIDEAALSGSK